MDSRNILFSYTKIKQEPNYFVIQVSVLSVWDHMSIRITAIELFAGHLISIQIRFLNLKFKIE